MLIVNRVFMCAEKHAPKKAKTEGRCFARTRKHTKFSRLRPSVPRRVGTQAPPRFRRSPRTPRRLLSACRRLPTAAGSANVATSPEITASAWISTLAEHYHVLGCLFGISCTVRPACSCSRSALPRCPCRRWGLF